MITTGPDRHLDGPPHGPDGRRVDSIDLVRGLVMVLMVLDHVRDYIGDAKLDPTDLATTTPPLFLTRWITHFCAPTFILLSGVSASLSGSRRTKGDLSIRLILRGLWLIVLEQTWCNVCMFFTYPHVALALILWAIGWSMIVLAFLIHLPRAVIGGLGLAMIVLHNLSDGVQFGGGFASLCWSLAHSPGIRVLPGGVPILIGYPLIPWVGVMAVGYALGPIFGWPTGRRRRLLMVMGAGCVAGFVALRASRSYGDPAPWVPGTGAIASGMSFLNCQKYPPSLLYLLMTLGPAFLALAALDRGAGPLAGPLRTFGRVPLCFYLLQWPVAHALAVLAAAIKGEPVGWMCRFPPFQSPDGYGKNLLAVYLFWGVTLALLYYPCLWYGRISRTSKHVPGSASVPLAP